MSSMEDIRLIGLVIILLVLLVISGQMNIFIWNIRKQIKKWRDK